MSVHNPKHSYSRRSGNATASLIAFGGLLALIALCWNISPVIAVVIGIPALMVCAWQLTLTPNYGVSFGKDLIKITSNKGAECVPVDKVAYLRLVSVTTQQPAAFVMRDGKEITLPDLALPDGLAQIRSMAAEHGVAIRAA